MADVLAAPYPPGLPTSPAEVGAALVSMRNTFWARDPQPMTLDLLPTPDAPAPPDSLRDAYRDLFHDGFDLVEPGPARYNFVVIRREDNDLAAVLVDDGQALVDDPDAGGVRTFPDVPALVEAYGGERRVKLVWERDQWPPSMNRFGADAMHLLSAAIRARHLGAHPYDRLGPAAPPVP
jgi:hypothetical protein